MSRQENKNRGEKQQKKNGNKCALTSLTPPTEQIALPAVNFVKYTCCSHSILFSCCFFLRMPELDIHSVPSKLPNKSDKILYKSS